MIERSATDRYERVFEHCASITAGLDIRAVSEATLVAARDLLGDPRLHLFNLKNDRVQLLASWPELPTWERPCRNEVVLRTVREGRPDYLTDLEVERTGEGAWPLEDARSALIVPLQASGRSIGVLTASSPERDAFTNTQRVMVMSLAPAIASGLHRAALVATERRTWQRQRELESDKALFIWIAAEELLGPLRASRSVTDRLRAEDPDDRAEAGRELESAARSLARQVESVLEIAASETWTGRNIERVKLDVALAGVRVAGNLPSAVVLADPSRLPRIMRYLIGETDELQVRREGDQIVVVLPGPARDQGLIEILARSVGAEVISALELSFEVVA